MTLGQEIETYQEDRTDILHHTEVLSEPFLKQYKGRNPKWGFDGLGYIVYKRTVTVRLKDTNDADYIVPDSKEGWMELWRKTLEAYLVTGKSFTFSTVCIRPEGQPIKTFGGIAPGPRPLREGTIELARILESRAGKKLRTPDVADIICCGGEVVRSGGVRRTALILQGDVDDFSFMNLTIFPKSFGMVIMVMANRAELSIYVTAVDTAV
jgi:hypothetical protein